MTGYEPAERQVRRAGILKTAPRIMYHAGIGRPGKNVSAPKSRSVNNYIRQARSMAGDAEDQGGSRISRDNT